MNPWEWLTTTTSVDNVFTTLGIGTLAFLFARDLIITKGQHLRRVQDLVGHHERERSAQDDRVTEMRESRDVWRETAGIERQRADKVTESFGKMADTMERMLHVLQSLDRALPHPVERGRDDLEGSGILGSR